MSERKTYKSENRVYTFDWVTADLFFDIQRYMSEAIKTAKEDNPNFLTPPLEYRAKKNGGIVLRTLALDPVGKMEEFDLAELVSREGRYLGFNISMTVKPHPRVLVPSQGLDDIAQKYSGLNYLIRRIPEFSDLKLSKIEPYKIPKGE